MSTKKGQEVATEEVGTVAFSRGAVDTSVAQTRIGFPISNENPFNTCYISSVESRDIAPDPDDEAQEPKTPALFIHLTHTDDDRMREDIALWPIVKDYENFTIKQQETKQDYVISHILGEFIEPPKGLGADATSWKDFFDKIADAFNKGKEGKPVYQDEKGRSYMCRVKLVRSAKMNKVEVPRYGPFFERVVEGKVSILQVTQYDNFTATAGGNKAAKAKAAGGRGDVTGGIKIPAGFS
jgi:hypothetical protein